MYSYICNTVRPLFTFFAIHLPVEILFGCNLATQSDYSNQLCLTVRQCKHTYSITFPATCVCVYIYILYICVWQETNQHTVDGSVISQLSTHWIKLMSELTWQGPWGPYCHHPTGNPIIQSNLQRVKNEAVIWLCIDRTVACVSHPQRCMSWLTN